MVRRQSMITNAKLSMININRQFIGGSPKFVSASPTLIGGLLKFISASPTLSMIHQNLSVLHP